MSILSQNITVDIGLKQAEPIHFVQGESGRTVNFTFINSQILDENDDPTVITPSDFDNIDIHILKPDGNFNIEHITVGVNTAIYTLSDQDCIAGGAGVYDLSLIKGDDVVYTAHGCFVGDFRAISNDTVESVSYAYGVPFPEGFQEKLIAGNNITIQNNVISASGGGGGDVTASASVDASVGTPSVNVTQTQIGSTTNFDFAFHNLKGVQGDPGAPGADGQDGADGVTPVISATASVDNNTGTPGVTVTKSGTDAAPSFAFDFVNLKGTQGEPGTDGTDGVGVPAGGSAGQVLTKVDGTDYNTAWITPSGGGGQGVGVTDVLYSGNALASVITLLHDLFDYDNIIIEVVDGNGYTRGYAFAPVELATSQIIGCDTAYGYIWYAITSGTTLTNVSNQNFYIGSIVGIKNGSTTADRTSYDNTVSGLTATDVQDAIDEVVDEVDAINSKISKNNLDTGVDLSPYNTTNNLYTCPDDGYIHIFRLTSSPGMVRIIIYPADSMTPPIAISGTSTASAQTEQCIFVRKGMRVMFATGGTALYYKLV